MRDLIGKGSTFNFQAVFKSAPDLYLILSPQLEIVEVNDSYLKATRVKREEILGRNVFTVFPDNPNDPSATGTKNLRASLARVLEQKTADTMAVQKYDIRRPESEGGGFEERYWSPINTPILDEDGEVKYIIHRVEDVTEFIRLKQSANQQLKIAEELRTHAGKMEAEIYQRAQEIQGVNDQLRTLNEELAKKKKEQEELYLKLENLSKLKTQFFANVSHELRTPLTLILGPLEKLLLNEALNVYQQDLTLIQRNARMLLHLINDLLDVAKLEAGKMVVNYVCFDLAKLLRQITALFESHAVTRQLKFSIQAPKTLMVEADPEKMQRVLMNILSNAFKYTSPKGRVKCSLSSKKNQVQLIISDNGPGIPEELKQSIFERFFRVNNPNSSSIGGFGLGLAIVKEYIELHGGSIKVDSPPEGGAEFIISLPLKAPSTAVVHPEPNISSDLYEKPVPLLVDEEQLNELASNKIEQDSGGTTSELEKGKVPQVLVVEDNKDLNKHICEILSSSYETVSAFDGREGLNKALALHPDVILSDIMMPKMNGVQLLQELRKLKELNNVPVIVLTAKADEELSVKLLSEGAQDYLAKPFSRAELKIRVANLVGLKKATEALAEKNAALLVANKELEAFSYSVSHDLRNPINAILGYSTLLYERTDLNLEEKDFLKEILNATKGMNDLVGDLLNFSHSTCSEMKREEVDLSALVEGLIQDLKKQNPDRKISCKIKKNLKANCDAHLMKIALQNLLQNAWKFTAKNENALIEFGLLQQEGPVYFIRDNGVGFPSDQVDKLFLPFSRLHMAKDFQGTGIGLSTVKRIIERHRGRVWAESEVGKGATFYLQF